MTANRKSIRLSMTIRIPAGQRPGDFAQRLQGYIEGVPGYSVDRVNCSEQKAGTDRSETDEQKERDKQEYVAAWMGKFASDEVLAQFRDGLLDRRVMLDMIANRAFSGLGLPEDDWAPAGKVARVQSLPINVYPTWVDLRGKLPEDHVAQFFRAVDSRHGVDVAIHVGPFRFERRIQLRETRHAIGDASDNVR